MTISPDLRQQLALAVLEIVTVMAPVKATAIREKLPKRLLAATDTSDVNSVLYNELKDTVFKDDATNAWSRVGATPADPPPVERRPERSEEESVPSRFTPTPEQQRAIDFAPDGHLLIRGEAGSGKTTVLAARAGRIKARFGTGSLLFLTYNGALAAYVKVLLEQEGGSQGVEVKTFHSWAQSFARLHGCEIRSWVTQREREERLSTALSAIRASRGAHRLLELPLDWWGAEIGWIYGRSLSTLSDYAEVARTGRGAAVQVRRDDRAVVWAVFDRYQQALRSENVWDMDDPGGLVFHAVAAREFKFDPDSRRDHVFVDEVQDFDKSWLLALMPIPAITLTLAGDLAQRIYRRSFTWKEVGVNVTGARSKSLKGSFRTTKQIMLVAQHVATNPDVKGDEDYLPPTIPDREGPAVVRIKRSMWRSAEEAALAWLVKEVKARPKDSWVVGVSFKKKAEEVGATLQAAGLKVEVARGEGLARERKGVVMVTTNFQLKGLEYDNVLLLGLDDSTMPGWFLKSVAEEDRDEAEPFHRRLVYVAMTRARRQLALAGGTPFCRFFDAVPLGLFDDR